MNIAFNHQNALVIKTLDLVLKSTGYLSSHTTVTAQRSLGPNILLLVYCQHRTRNILYQKGFNKWRVRKSVLFKIAFANILLKVCPPPTCTHKYCIHISSSTESAISHPHSTKAHEQITPVTFPKHLNT